MKNILIIVSSLYGGGAEKVAANLSLMLDGNKWIVIFEKESEDLYHYNGVLVNLDLYSHKNSFGKLDTFYKFYKKLLEIKKLKKDLCIDVSISFMEEANLINILTPGSWKNIISIHSHKSLDEGPVFRKFVKNLLIKLLYNHADCAVAVSEGVSTDLIKNYGVRKEKLQVVYNAINNEMLRSSAIIPIDERLEKILERSIITVGRLTRQKGLWNLLRIFMFVKMVIPNAKLVFLGRGDLEDILIDLSRQYGLKTFVGWKDSELFHNDADVFFLGFVKNPESYISKAKVMALTSLWEGFGNVIVESMAVGTPVVSADCKSGPREILSSDKDYSNKLTAPYFADYGILMPELSVSSKGVDEPITSEEIHWRDTLSMFFSDDKFRDRYAEKAILRSQDFDFSVIKDVWERLI